MAFSGPSTQEPAGSCRLSIRSSPMCSFLTPRRRFLCLLVRWHAVMVKFVSASVCLAHIAPISPRRPPYSYGPRKSESGKVLLR